MSTVNLLADLIEAWTCTETCIDHLVVVGESWTGLLNDADLLVTSFVQIEFEGPLGLILSIDVLGDYHLLLKFIDDLLETRLT